MNCFVFHEMILNTNSLSLLFYRMQANGEIELLLLTEKLIKDGIKHDIWFDEKTTTATCIALKPYNQQTVPEYIKALKLFE